MRLTFALERLCVELRRIAPLLLLFTSTLTSAGWREYLPANEFLKVNEIIISKSKQFFAIQQGDGNFCVYERRIDIDGMMHGGRHKGTVQYCTLSKGQSTGPYFTIMQGDGNLCTYRGTGPGDNKGSVFCASNQPRAGNQFFAVVSDDGSFAIHAGTDPMSSKGLVWVAKNPEASAPEQLIAESALQDFISGPQSDCTRYLGQNEFNACVTNNIAYPKAEQACKGNTSGKGGYSRCLAQHLPHALPLPPKPTFTAETGPRYNCTQIEDAALQKQCIKINLSWDKVMAQCQLGSKGARNKCLAERMPNPPKLFYWDESKDTACRTPPVPQRCRDLARVMDACPVTLSNEFIQADCLIKFHAGKSNMQKGR